MRQMAAMRKVHAEYRVARLQNGGIRSLVRLRSRVWLHVDIFCTKELLCAFASEAFDHIRVFATPVIALPWISFGVFISEN